MRRPHFALSLVLLPALLPAHGQIDCQIYNTDNYATTSSEDAQQHDTYDHNDNANIQQFCLYAGGSVPQGVVKQCTVQCTNVIDTTPSESGVLSYSSIQHSIADVSLGGENSGQANGAACSSLAAVGVNSCPSPGACPMDVVLLNPNGTGLFSDGYQTTPTNPLWKTALTTPLTTCPAKNWPICEPTSIPVTPDEICTWETSTCSWACTPLGDHTPIIIDTDGSGFHLTSAAKGIKWDFYGNGNPIQIAWTAPGSTNGWLALPDAKGRITSAHQLFSNIAPQNLKVADNGFNALVTYDTNGDGVIDKKDNPWWGQLRVWIDANHDGIAQPNELYTLDSLGITGISLAYTSSPKTDQYGNQFNLKGTLTRAAGDDVRPVIYDVTLVAK